jgi:hypothetical protein
MAWLSYCFGNSAHRWMYDFSALSMLLEEAGFLDVRRCDLGDCDDSKFALVEDMNRFYDDGEPELSIHAQKPEASA